MPRRRARDTVGTCRLCLQERSLSFEHVPPRAALNTRKVELGDLRHWLERDNEGMRLRRAIQQGGSGFSRFCEDCNSHTGSWYASELVGWVRAAAGAVHALPPRDQMDAELNDHGVTLCIEEVRPLAFVKQVVTMVLAVNDVEFAERHPELREFVWERDRTQPPEDLQIYLTLYLGPIVRFLGVQRRTNLETHEIIALSEVAYPPFSYVATFDEPSPLLAAGNITGFADIPYTTTATAEIEMMVGFGHTPYPADYRTAAQLNRDRKWNAGDM